MELYLAKAGKAKGILKKGQKLWGHLLPVALTFKIFLLGMNQMLTKFQGQ